GDAAIPRLEMPSGALNLAFDRRGDTLAVLRGDGAVALYDGRTGAARGELPSVPPGQTALALHPDGGLVAVPGQGHAIDLVPASGGPPTQSLAGHRDIVTCVCFSLDGRLLASASRDGTV